MTLFVIIASLFLDRILDAGKSRQWLKFIDELVNYGLERAQDNIWQGSLVLLLTILVPAVLVNIFAEFFDDQLYGLLALLWSVLVLFVCIGPRPLEIEVDKFLQLAQGEDETLLNEQAYRLTGEEHFADENARNTAVTRAMFAHLNTYIVAVVFWFIVLGPFGAVLYRISLRLTGGSENNLQLPDELHERLTMMMGALTWLPARVLLLAYALGGKFECTLDNWLGLDSTTEGASLFDENNTVLSDAGECALAVQSSGDVAVEDVRAARRLAIRALAICLALVALMTLSGWFA
jgi:AmpE protein